MAITVPNTTAPPAPFCHLSTEGWKIGDRVGLVYDIEIYPNYFTAAFFDGVGKWHRFSLSDDINEIRALSDFVSDRNLVLIGFNNFSYDDAMLGALMRRPDSITINDLKVISDLLIADHKLLTPEQNQARNKLIYGEHPWHASADLFQILNKKAGLKELECRMGLAQVADCPIPFDHPVRADQRHLIDGYNRADIEATHELLTRHTGLVDMRSELETRYDLGTSVYRESEPQIAEHYLTNRYRAVTGKTKQELKKLSATSSNNITASFAVSSLMPSDITFQTPEFQAVHQALVAGTIDRNGGKFKLCTSMPDNEVHVGGIKLTFGCGGLHSVDEPGIFRSDETGTLLDIDVTSFYPGMMIEQKIKPDHMLSTFTDIVRELRDQRVTAKKAKHTLLANALKIVINSIFGKLGDQFSALRDDRACMKVTLTGQVYLLLLIELVTLAGATVLSANTDGLLLRVPATCMFSVTAARVAWERQTRLFLEETPYSVVARRDVNNYMAISTKLDENNLPIMKGKGAFNPDAAKTSGSVSVLAAVECLRSGTPIAEFIQRHDSAVNFCFYARSQKDGHFIRDDERLPRTVRWYSTVTTGDQDQDDARTIKRVSTAGTTAAIPHGANATLALTLTTTRANELIGLDRAPYIAAAQALLDSALASPEVEQGTLIARRLQAQGLVLLPMNGHKNPNGVKLDDFGAILDLQSSRSRFWAIVTGEFSETLTLDLDKPEKIDPALTAILMRHTTLTSWHGDGSAEAVRQGAKRGAVHFRFAGGDLRIRTKSEKAWTEAYGFEVAYGKKIQTVIGPHRTAGDEYVVSGDVVDAPPELIEYLGLRLKQPRKTTSKVAVEVVTSADDLARLAAAADAVLGAGWGSAFDDGKGWIGVSGVTPEHRSDLRLFLRDQQVCAHTFHASYDTKGTASLVQAEYDSRRPDPDPDGNGDQPPADEPDIDGTLHLDPSDRPAALDVEARQTAVSCIEAFRRPEKIIAINGPTGSGKSYASTSEALDRHERGERTLIVVQDKEAIEQARRYLLKQAEERGMDLTKLKFRIAVSARGAEADDMDESAFSGHGSSSSEIPKETLIVITHHHFASRKPLTRDLHAPLYWIAHWHGLVIIDEVDLFIERQNCTETMSSRYKHIGGTHGQFNRLTHCPSSTGAFSCKTCVARPGGSLVNHGTHLAYTSPVKLTRENFAKTQETEFTLSDEHLPTTKTIDLPEMNLRLKALEQTDNYLRVRTFERPISAMAAAGHHQKQLTPKEEFLAYARDLIDCSWMPTLAEALPVDKDGHFVETDPNLGANDTIGTNGQPSVSMLTTIDWTWPYWLCRSKYLLLYDRAPLYFLMQQAEQVVVMSATIGEMQIEYLSSCASGQSVVAVDLPDPDRRPLTRIHVIAHQGHIDWTKTLSDTAARALGCDLANTGISNRTTIERLGNALVMAGHPPLVFLGKKEGAKKIFDMMKERGWSLFIEGTYQSHAGKAVSETEQTNGTMSLISYARSSLGTGANLPGYDVVIVDGTVVRPHFVFNPAEKSQDAFLTMQEDDRLRIMTQNVGRILRGSGVKTVFVVGLSQGQTEQLAERISTLTQEPVETWYTTDDTNAAFATLVATVRAGVLTPVAPIVVSADKAVSQLSAKQRAAKATADPVEKAALKLRKAIATVIASAEAGNGWRAVARKVHPERYSEAEVEQLRAAFTSAGGVLPAEDAA